jgi:hypothetical protein
LDTWFQYVSGNEALTWIFSIKISLVGFSVMVN